MALTKRERPFHILKHWVFLKGISRPNSARHSEGAWAPGVGGVVQECISWANPHGALGKLLGLSVFCFLIFKANNSQHGGVPS